MRSKHHFLIVAFLLFSIHAGAWHRCNIPNLWVNGTFEDTATGILCSGLNSVNNYSNPNPPYYGSTTFIFIAGQTLQPAYLNEPTIDHTTNAAGGHYLYCDPRNATGYVYQVEQSINVLPNTNYTFSAWFCSMLSTSFAASPATVQLFVNGTAVSLSLTLSSTTPNNWIQLSGTWNSGSSTVALASITDYNPVVTGHDFAIDDISFGPGFLQADAGKDTCILLGQTYVLGGNPTAAYGASCSGLYHYLWVPTIGFVSPDTVSNPTVNIPTVGTYSYVVTVTDLDHNTCTDTVSICAYVKTIPDTVTITASDSCNKYVFTAHSGDTSINSYHWDFGDSHTGTGNPVTHVYTSPGTYSVTLITTNSSGYKDTIHYTSVSYNPITVKAYSDTAICYGYSAQLNATGASNYSWSPASGLSDTQIPNPVAAPKVPTEYVVTGSDSSGCKGSDSVFVNVFPKPLLQISSDGKEINCKNDSVQLFASGLAKYNWQPATYCSNATSSQPEVYPTASTQFVVSGTDSNGCYASDSISVKADISTAFFMPNAFTPNNDGHNDEIYPIAYCDFILDEFSVYNRWGQLVFTTHTYEKGWNGEFNNVPQPIDSYYYYVKGHNNLGNKIMFKGDITLVR